MYSKLQVRTKNSTLLGLNTVNIETESVDVLLEKKLKC